MRASLVRFRGADSVQIKSYFGRVCIEDDPETIHG